MTVSSIPTRNVSLWTRRQKIGRLLWSVTYHLIFRKTFHNWYGLRSVDPAVVRSKIGRNARIRRTAHIEIPWNLMLGDDVSIGDEAILYSLGTIRMGNRSFLSQYGSLCRHP